MTKALESGADAVILDLEDSVPLASKAEARALVAKAIDAAAASASRPMMYVRVNAATHRPSVGRSRRRDPARSRRGPAVEGGKRSRTCSRCAAAIDRHEAQRGMKHGSAEIILQIENALGVYNCFNLIKASPRVAATCFGSARDGDLQTDLGCSWSIEGTELLYARSKVLLDTRAAGSHIFPLDGVFSRSQRRGRADRGFPPVGAPRLYRPHRHSSQADRAGQRRLCRARRRGRLLQEGSGRIRRRGKSRHRRHLGRRQTGRLRHGATRPARARTRQSRRGRGDRMDFSFSQDQETLRAHVEGVARSTSARRNTPSAATTRRRRRAKPIRRLPSTAGSAWPSPPNTAAPAVRPSTLPFFWKKPAGTSKNWRCGCSARSLTADTRCCATARRSRKRDLLPKVARGELSFCFGLTEPASGSDAAALTTRAKASRRRLSSSTARRFSPPAWTSATIVC